MLGRREFLGTTGLAMLALPASRLAAASIVVSPAGLIFLTIEANGRSAKALVDTGAIRGLQLAEAFARTLGLALADTGQQTQRYQGGPRAVLGASLDTLAFGGATYRGVEALVSPGDIEAIAAQIGEPFDAILGWPMLSKAGFVIDYAAKDLTVRDGPGAGLVLPLAATPLPVTAGTLNGEAVTFLIDTGAPWCNVDAALAGGAAANSRLELPFEIGGKAFSTQFRVKDLTAMTRGIGARAVIGHRFLERFKLMWNPGEHMIRLA
ncbi:retroviral-like aspartic protease family protein [Sphingomonas sp. LB-2]|uniref:retropepsin-like aspartic protease n=1 Tax=Sphingomonas caeni TaxID=2984949 RepID=UPI0022302185|nr:retropepsin-like aspartic protease [Sphingomonas caeni]MCW3847236.1 retroviral-like aspartic protease family protein [Sphingomonas caeni]